MEQDVLWEFGNELASNTLEVNESFVKGLSNIAIHRLHVSDTMKVSDYLNTLYVMKDKSTRVSGHSHTDTCHYYNVLVKRQVFHTRKYHYYIESETLV